MTRYLGMLRRHPWVLAVPSFLVIAASLAAVVGDTWLLTGDFSHTEFLVRAIPSHPPLIGVAARVVDNGSTPGPSMAYLLFPGYRLFGSNAFALASSVALLHVVGIVASLWLARRLGGLGFAACASVTVTVLTVALAPRFFLEPWNVWVPVFAFAAFLFLVWGLSLGRVAMLPWAAAVGTHCVQTHVSYVVLVVGLLGPACLWLLWLGWRTDRLAGRHALRWWASAAAVSVLMWMPPLIEQLRPGTGNLSKLVRQFTSPDAPYVGVRAALRVVASRFNLLGAWLREPGTNPLDAPNWWGFIAFVALIVTGATCAWRRWDQVEGRLYLVLGSATLLGVFSTMRVFGTFFEYVIRWMLPLVAWWVAAAAWSITRTVRARHAVGEARSTNGVDKWLSGALAFCLVVFSALGVAKASSATVPYARDVMIAAELSRTVRAELDPSLVYQVNEADPVSLGSVGFGLALDLERHGWRSGVGEWGAAGTMQHRVVVAADADAALWYVATDPLIDAFAAVPGAVVVAEYDPRTAAEVARSEVLERKILDVLCAEGGVDVARLMYVRGGRTTLTFLSSPPAGVHEMLEELNGLGQATAVVRLDPAVPGYDVRVPSPLVCP